VLIRVSLSGDAIRAIATPWSTFWRDKVKPENNPKTILLRVEGMDCADCALHLEKAALGVPGVRSAEVSFATGRMRLVAEEGERVLPQVEAVARQMGYQVLPATPTGGGAGWRDWLRRHPRVWPTALAGLLLLAALAPPAPPRCGTGC
jgi:Cd2+/Zn2+-exporting ATPase